MDGRLNLEGQGSLYIGRLEGSDSGLYTCRATNMEDSLDADAMLRVLGEYLWRPLLSRPLNSSSQIIDSFVHLVIFMVSLKSGTTQKSLILFANCGQLVLLEDQPFH